jgi:DNA-binding phage protein
MPRKKISNKRGFSLRGIKAKKRIRRELYSVKNHFKNPRMIFSALIQTLKDGDSESFKDILATHLASINKNEFSRRTDIPKRTLFRMLSSDGNPTLDNVAKLLHALYVF